MNSQTLKKKKIGVIGRGGEWSALPVVRELGKKGFEVYCFFLVEDSIICRSKYLKKMVELGSLESQSSFQKLVKLLHQMNIEILICLDEELKYILTKNVSRLGDFKWAFPPFSSYKIAISKTRSNDFVKNLGIPVPKTQTLDSIQEVERIKFKKGERFVIKGERGASSLHVKYPRNTKELIRFYREIVEMESENETASSYPILQEYKGGPTYLTQGMSQKGKAITVIPHRKIREWPLSGGVSSRAVTIDAPRLINYMKTILEALNWHGEAGMEWKYDEKQDDYYFIEMNPRFEGSLDIAVKSEANLPLMLIDIIEGKSLKADFQNYSGTHYRWFFRNDFKVFLEKPYGIGRLITESINPKINGELSLDDMGILQSFWSVPLRQIKMKISSE